jgi:hypothetical protein
LIEWKSDYFHQLNQQLLVPSAATIDTVFAAQPEAEFLGPYAQGEAGTELIKVCRTCFVPPRYVPLFLAGPIKPREAWERVRGQIVTEGQEVACQALIKFFQAVITRVAVGDAPALSLGTHSSSCWHIVLDHVRESWWRLPPAESPVGGVAAEPDCR